MVQSINKHCGGSLRKQLSEVMDVFRKSPLQKTRQGALKKLKKKSNGGVLLGHSPPLRL